MTVTTLEERFWSKVDRRGPDECWEWTAHKSPQGYGRICAGPRGLGVLRAHRVAYELFVGPVPDGLELDQCAGGPTCPHRRCVLRGNGVTALNAVKTACLHGHPFTPENTLVRLYEGRLSRECLACRADYNARRRLLRGRP